MGAGRLPKLLAQVPGIDSRPLQQESQRGRPLLRLGQRDVLVVHWGLWLLAVAIGETAQIQRTKADSLNPIEDQLLGGSIVAGDEDDAALVKG